MATHEHTTAMATQLVRFGALFGRQQSIDLGECLGANGGRLAHESAGACGKLIDVGIGLACLNSVAQGQPVLFELLSDGLRGFAC